MPLPLWQIAPDCVYGLVGCPLDQEMVPNIPKLRDVFYHLHDLGLRNEAGQTIIPGKEAADIGLCVLALLALLTALVLPLGDKYGRVPSRAVLPWEDSCWTKIKSR